MGLPPAPKLAFRSTLAQSESTVDDCNPKKTRDRAQGSLRALEPTRLFPPPPELRGAPNTMLLVSIGCMVMAGVVYYFLETGPSSSSKPTVQSQVAYMDPKSTSEPASAPPPAEWVQADPSPAAPSENRAEAATAEKSVQPAVAAAAITGPEPQTAAVRSAVPASTATVSTESSRPTRRLDPETISLLVREAEKHISTGDVVTARTIFQRAAEAGDATAALELAATYDPTVLAKLGVMGMGADVEKARVWYRMAESFGSAEAKQRLLALDRK